jgi:hypothetical protein
MGIFSRVKSQAEAAEEKAPVRDFIEDREAGTSWSWVGTVGGEEGGARWTRIGARRVRYEATESRSSTPMILDV